MTDRLGEVETPLIPAFARQKQVDLEFEASLVCRTSPRTARTTQRKLISDGKQMHQDSQRVNG